MKKLIFIAVALIAFSGFANAKPTEVKTEIKTEVSVSKKIKKSIISKKCWKYFKFFLWKMNIKNVLGKLQVICYSLR